MRLRRPVAKPASAADAHVDAGAHSGAHADAQAQAQAPTVTQRRILDAALALFAERGYDGVSTAQIAARAEVAEKTLFANFGSKQRLYDATLGPAGLRLIFFPEAMRTLLPVLEHPPADPEGLLRALIVNRVGFLRQHVREARLVIQHVLREPESVQALSDLWDQRIRPTAGGLLDGLVGSGRLRGDIPMGRVVRMVVAQIAGYAVLSTLFRPDLPWDDEREVSDMVSVLLYGLAPREATTRAGTGPGGKRRAGPKTPRRSVRRG